MKQIPTCKKYGYKEFLFKSETKFTIFEIIEIDLL